MDHATIKLPRLYVDHDLAVGAEATLAEGQAHYLRSVMRLGVGDAVRLFNGRDGEALATLRTLDKKSAVASVTEQIRPQPPAPGQTHLLFTPLKKDALDFLIEKSVELGVTHLHPVLTHNTDVRRINDERLRQQIIEAAEQCERLTVPALAPLQPLETVLAAWNKKIPLFAALERFAAPGLPQKFPRDIAFLIGPAGGFTEGEKAMLAPHAVQLGPAILRAETAALLCLSARLLTLKNPLPSGEREKLLPVLSLWVYLRSWRQTNFD